MPSKAKDKNAETSQNFWSSPFLAVIKILIIIQDALYCMGGKRGKVGV